MNRLQNLFGKIKFPKIKFSFKQFSIRRAIVWIVAIAVAVVLFIATRSLATCWNVTQLPGIAPASCGATTEVLNTPVVNQQGTAVATPPPTPLPDVPQSNLPVPWDGASRVNLLFMGLDYRDWLANEGPPRTDTMILFTLDPQSKTAGMLSIPRDMWVNIPGFGYSRINTAYPSGEGSRLPGGGPALAMKTVSQFIGVPVQYYAIVDFYAFEKTIDLMGGLYICIPQKIRIDPIGNKRPENLKPGCQNLYGYQALAYARNRYTENGDIDRANRQQQVILALRDQIFTPQNFPRMIAKAPEIYKVVASGVHTNLSFEDAMRLAALMNQISPQNIKRGVIDYTMGILDNVILAGQNASIMKPIPDKIRVLRDEIFSSTGPVGPLATGDPRVLMTQDAARVRILNGSVSGGLDQRAANYFISQGMQVTETGNSPQAYSRTVVVLYSPKLYTLKYLQAVLGISANNQIVISPDPNSTVDVEIRLGNDAVNSFP